MVSQNQLHIVVAQGYVYKDDKFIILKRSEKEIVNPGEWVVPGGKVEGSDSVRTTLEKEIREETGIKDIGKIEFLGDQEFARPDGLHVIVIKFKVEAKSEEVKFDHNDFTEYAWVDKDNIDSFPKIIPAVREQIKELLG